ncbi:MAG: hypothetical protein V3V74_07225 [Nitrosomonadaceae bacterium]
MKIKAAVGICAFIALSAVIWGVSTPKSSELALKQEAPASTNLVSQFNNKNIVVVGTWAHQATKLRLVKRGVDFYLEFKNPTAIATIHPVITKNLGRDNKRLIVYESTEKW